MYAAYFNDLLLMQRLYIQGWQPNAYDYDKRTALSVAASQGNLEAVKYLITHGANPFHRDFRHNNALDDATREKRIEVVEYLTNSMTSMKRAVVVKKS